MPQRATDRASLFLRDTSSRTTITFVVIAMISDTGVYNCPKKLYACTIMKIHAHIGDKEDRSIDYVISCITTTT
jgi:hypothetical protein